MPTTAISPAPQIRSNGDCRVLVADDFRPIRELVGQILGECPGLQVISEASDGHEAVRQAHESQPDLILLDIGLPTLNGIEAAKRIRATCPGSKVLFVSQLSSPDIVREALKVGGCGYVLKARLAADLIPAIEAVLGDEQFVSEGLL